MKRLLVPALLLVCSLASAAPSRRTPAGRGGGLSQVFVNVPLTGSGTAASHLSCPTCALVQASTPGAAQTGHLNLTGDVLSSVNGWFGASSSSAGSRTGVAIVDGTSVAAYVNGTRSARVVADHFYLNPAETAWVNFSTGDVRVPANVLFQSNKGIDLESCCSLLVGAGNAGRVVIGNTNSVQQVNGSIQFTPRLVADADVTLTSKNHDVFFTSLTAPRNAVMPPANDEGAGLEIRVRAPAATGTNTVTLSRAGADTINGGTTYVCVAAANGACACWNDGTSAWQCVKMTP